MPDNLENEATKYEAPEPEMVEIEFTELAELLGEVSNRAKGMHERLEHMRKELIGLIEHVKPGYFERDL